MPRTPTTIEVAVKADGSVKWVRVYRSSGDPATDAIGLRMARRSRYEPASRNCRYVSGVYFYVEDWRKDGT